MPFTSRLFLRDALSASRTPLLFLSPSLAFRRERGTSGFFYFCNCTFVPPVFQAGGSLAGKDSMDASSTMSSTSSCGGGVSRSFGVDSLSWGCSAITVPILLRRESEVICGTQPRLVPWLAVLGTHPLFVKGNRQQLSPLGQQQARRFLTCTISHAPTLNRCSLRNASKSALIWSALVVGMPCGKPL